MIAVFSVLIVFTMSIVILRIATVGLTMTGVSKDLAKLQALSAFTGSGFTTAESEEIVNHPVRRRIVMHLMLLGHIGVVVAIPSVILSFLVTGERTSATNQLMVRGCVLSAGLLLLLLLANSRYVERLLWEISTWALRRFAHLQIHDYTRLLRVGHNYVVSELFVESDDWLAGHTLQQLQLASEGILVLGIEKAGGEYLGAPRGQSHVDAGDCLILYGRHDALVELDERRAGMEGNMRHVVAVTRQLDEREIEDGAQP